MCIRDSAGTAALDDGEIRRASALRIAHVAQEPVFADAATVYDTVAIGLGEAGRLLADYHHATTRLAEHPGDCLLYTSVAVGVVADRDPLGFGPFREGQRQVAPPSSETIT